MKLRDVPIQRKLMVVIMITTLTVLFLTAAAFIAYELVTYRRTLLQTLGTLAEITADNNTGNLSFLDEKTAGHLLSTLRAEPQIELAALYDKQGKLFARYPQALSTNLFPASPGPDRRRFEEGRVVIVLPASEGETRHGTLYLRASLEPMRARFRLYAGIVVIVLANSSLVALGLSNALQKRISQPILALAETAKVISSRRDYSVRARKISEDELGALTDAFNHMLTQIHEREAALRQSSERLRLALEASQTGTWDWNVQTNTMVWDEYTERLFGLEPGQFKRTFEHALELVHPDDRPFVSAAIQHSLEHKHDLHTEFRVVWPDGSLHHMHSRGKPFLDDRGKAVRMAGAILDVSVSKRAEEALRESEALLRAVVDTAVDGIITIDENGAVQTINPAAETIFGYPSEEVVGRNIRMLMPEPYSSEHNRYLEHYLQTGEKRIIGIGREVHGLRKDGTIFPLELSVSETFLGGRRIFTGMVRDITERRRAEEEIRNLNAELERRVQDRTAELATTNKELEAFTYSVSHDLRAPLRHVDAYAQILEEELGPNISLEAKKYITRIRHGVQHMGHLVDDLLNLARVGRQELVRQATGLNTVVADVLEELKSDMEGRDIEWRIEQLPWVECDPGLIRQVFANLISNALKYTRPRPHALIQIGHLEEHGQPVIFVKDNGVGFSMKYASKLFGVFQRLHRAEDFEGTGVGLATVDRIIRKHGGRVWAHAELDKGATFYFTLKGADVESAKSPNQAAHETRGS